MNARNLQVVPDAPKFDPTDEDQMHDAIGCARLVKPIMDLLDTLACYERTEASFGADRAKVVATLIPELRALRSAIRTEWEDL